MKKIQFTIGIPAYERLDYTRELLESCLAQTYPHFEIIIGDDSQSDDIENLVRQMNSSKIRYYRHHSPKGLVGNMNFIVSVTQNPWMLIMANDDLLEREYLERLEKVVRQNRSAALVRTRYRMIDDCGNVIRLDRRHPFRMSSFEFLSRVFLRQNVSPWMSISAVAFPTKNLKIIGGFRNYHRGHHTDRIAWAELAAFGDCFFIPLASARIRSHRGEITTTMDPEYEKAVDSTMEMSRLMKDLLAGMEFKAVNDEDYAYLKTARERLEEYTTRQIARSFDQGLMGRLENRKLKTWHDLNAIKKKIDELNAPAFFSFYFYSLLMMLPVPIRYHILPWFKEYKFRRWHL